MLFKSRTLLARICKIYLLKAGRRVRSILEVVNPNERPMVRTLSSLFGTDVIQPNHTVLHLCHSKYYSQEHYFFF